MNVWPIFKRRERKWSESAVGAGGWDEAPPACDTCGFTNAAAYVPRKNHWAGLFEARDFVFDKEHRGNLVTYIRCPAHIPEGAWVEGRDPESEAMKPGRDPEGDKVTAIWEKRLARGDTPGSQDRAGQLRAWEASVRARATRRAGRVRPGMQPDDGLP